MNKPLIGINPYYYSYKDAWWMATKEDYTAVVWSNGGIPLMLHYPPRDVAATEIIERIDGLLMVGGPDFHSNMYGGQNPELLSEIIHHRREAFDRDIFQEARRNGKPILAICAGMQHINLIYGGSLYEDIPTQLEANIDHGEFDGDYSTHTVKLDRSCMLYTIMAEDEPMVRSTHHQGVKILGEQLRPVAWSEDGLIEAFEDLHDPQAFIATQWHPELFTEDPANRQIFEWLINEANRRKNIFG